MRPELSAEALLTPVQASSASTKAFETVEPLAVRLGMEPQQNARTPESGGAGVFDNCFAELDHQVIPCCAVKSQAV